MRRWRDDVIEPLTGASKIVQDITDGFFSKFLRNSGSLYIQPCKNPDVAQNSSWILPHVNK